MPVSTKTKWDIWNYYRFNEMVNDVILQHNIKQPQKNVKTNKQEAHGGRYSTIIYKIGEVDWFPEQWGK